MMESLTSQQFKELVLNSKGRVLVDFSAVWCGPCRMMAPAIEQLAEEKAGEVAVYSVDVDKCPDIAMQYRISAVPTCILFKDGESARRFTGAQPIDVLRDFVER
ncbi:MAG: thioredoxin [Eggerthellales bacterium]|nr:thioredoxin [Eggerthellales bacterium]